MSSEPAITARELGKAYRFYKRPFDRLKQMAWRGKRIYYEEFWALRHVDFDIYRGETIGIIGRNGAGKSTLLQLLCGTVTPTEGRHEVRGRIAALLELGAGFNPEFTGRDNVFVNAAILGLDEAQIRARFDDIAAFADIGDFMDHPVKTYSSGMYARLAFSVAVHVDPEILIVDEILAVGDQGFQRKCLERFYKIRDSGCTILFVSHDPYQVKSLCQRAIYLVGGQCAAYGPAADVIDRYIVDMEAATARSRPSSAGPPCPTTAATPPPGAP
ncbi:MAG: ABC transporter ATP-binding protein, partial [Planctomycetota bacterium]